MPGHVVARGPGVDVVVRLSGDAALSEHVGRALESLSALPTMPPREQSAFDVYADVDAAPRVLDRVVAAVNARVVSYLGRTQTALHAGAVQSGTATVVLPAPTGAGKSTLVAGLVREGWRYLTDEAVLLDRGLTAHPYPKPLSVEPGSQGLFTDLRDPPFRGTTSWYLRPMDLTADWRAVPARPSVVLLPEWAPGRVGSVEPLTPGHAVMALATRVFAFGDHPVRHLERLVRLARSVPVARIRYPDLATGCRLVRECTTGLSAVPAQTVPPGPLVHATDDGLLESVLGGEVVVYDRHAGSLYLLDATGADGPVDALVDPSSATKVTDPDIAEVQGVHDHTVPSIRTPNDTADPTGRSS
ncbi:MAG: hypothetical protein ACLGIV_03400 [Actinomycetes bacterium]